jgi:DNA-directed RNA polymerase
MSNEFENMEYCIAHTHEEQMMESGRKRAEKRRDANIMRNDASVTSSGKSMVSRAIQPMADHIIKFFNESGVNGKPHMAFVYAKEIPPETIAVITAKHIINMMVQRKALTATAISLGEKIETEVALRNFAEANRNLYQTVKANLDKRSWNYNYKRRKFRESAIRDAEGNWIKWTTNEKLQVGTRFIDIFIQSTGLVGIGTETFRQKKRKVLNYTKENLEWISKRESYTELLHPDYLPTITPPKDWTTVEGGGYITSVLPDLDLVKVKNKKFKETLRGVDMPEVYNAVNNMQRTPFRVNKKVLDVAYQIWDEGLGRGEIPTPNLVDIPNRPHDIDTNAEARKLWRNAAATAHTLNKTNMSKVILYTKIIGMAKQLQHHEKIYFPLQLDFRGRVYCVPAFLNYQSNTMSKALLEFVDGAPITQDNDGIFYLAMHGANMFGYDKVNLEERVAWVNKHAETIKQCAVDPLGTRWWEEADKPFQFLAFCFEWTAWLEHRDNGTDEEFISHLPIAVDGSCNGLQLYSLLLRDKDSGALVNVVPADKPADVYQQLADVVIVKLKAETENPMAQQWLSYGIKRSTVKRAIMTSVYGSTRYSCSDFVLEDLKKRQERGEQHPFSQAPMAAASYLSGYIWSALAESLASAKVGMSFLQKIAKVVAKDDVPIHWTTPTGFYVQQFYPEMKTKRVKTMLMGEVFKPRVKEETDKMDGYRMSNGIAPNFIHALDSSALMRTVNIATENGVQNFATVHDSFGTTAGDMNVLLACIKTAFVEIFNDANLLEDFLTEVKTQISNPKLLDKLPDVPKQSDLNIEDLMDCDFFFS